MEDRVNLPNNKNTTCSDSKVFNLLILNNNVTDTLQHKIRLRGGDPAETKCTLSTVFLNN